MSLSRGASQKSGGGLGSRKGSALSLKDMVLRRGSSRRELFTTVGEGLRQHYNKTLKPFEELHGFHTLHSPPLEDADFTGKPSVLLVGQYSTGKTTLIRYLLGEDFMGCRIGPEPTTDKFHVIMAAEEEGEDPPSSVVVPGNALVVDPQLPFRPLAKFGNTFLNRFQLTRQKNPLLSEITLIDSPGILAGEKQNCDRGYNYVEVLEWFASRVDLVLVLFDAHKLDISDELRRAIEALGRFDDKIRIILNKADGVDGQELMRVYGALMWSLGKVLVAPEVPRVYIGSWWDGQLGNASFRTLFELEEQDLFKDFRLMPRSAALRKLNDLIKRARLARVLALIVGELHEAMPVVFGKEAKKKSLLKHLEQTIEAVEAKHGTCAGDLPPLDTLRESLAKADWSKFRSVEPRQLAKLDRLLTEDLSRLLAILPTQAETASIVLNGPIQATTEDSTPFGPKRSLQSDRWRLSDASQWVVSADEAQLGSWLAAFQAADPTDGKLTGRQARQVLMESRLPNSVLSKVWSLADSDRDGMLDEEEFCLAMYLIEYKLAGNDLPCILPPHLKPPSHRPGRGSVGSELGSLGEDGEEEVGGGAGGGHGAQGAQGGSGRRAGWHVGAQEPHPPPRKRGGSQGEGSPSESLTNTEESS